MAARRSSAPSSDNGVRVPKLNKDPVWSLKPWPVAVTLGGLDFEIPALPAADWLAVLMKDELDLSEFLFEMIPDSEIALFNADISIDAVYSACLDVIGLVSARNWWITLRLIGVARESWDVLGGEMIFRNVDAARISLSAWLDVLLLVILRSMDPKDTTSFTMRLEMPPEGEEVPPEELEMSADQFLAMGR